jgi:hypothetical protein
LVRLVEGHRRGTTFLFPGTLLELPDAEAMVLVQDGIAVPVRDEVAAEYR